MEETFLAIIPLHDLAIEGKTVIIAHIWSDTELMALTLGAHHETVVME